MISFSTSPFSESQYLSLLKSFIKLNFKASVSGTVMQIFNCTQVENLTNAAQGYASALLG